MPLHIVHPASTSRERTQEFETRRSWASLLRLIALMAIAGAALRLVGGAPRMPEIAPSLDAFRAALTGSTLPLEPLVSLLVGLAWLLWLWIVLSLALELLLLAAEGLARGAGWLRSVRRVTDRLTAPMARRAVAAAFAVQILSRSVPVAAAEPLHESQVVSLVQQTASAESFSAGARTTTQADDEPTAARVYRVEAGDTLWTIADKTYGSGTEYRRLVQANIGRRMPDGQTFTARGVIQPGWELLLPEIRADVQEVDGQRWYTVQPGDTLSGIAARLLKDENAWSVLLELNRGATSPDGAHVLSDPNLIWPGLQLQLPDTQTAAATEPDPADPEDNTAPASAAVIASGPQPSPDTTAQARSRVDGATPRGEAELSVAAAPGPVSAMLPPSDSEPAPLLRTIHPVPPVALDQTSDPAAPQNDAAAVPEVAPPQPADVPLPVVPIAAGGAALALTATLAGVALQRRRRLQPLSREPESDIVVHGGYAAAELTHDFTRGLQGAGFDAASAVVSQVRACLLEYHLEQVTIVAVRHGRSSTTLTLSAGVSEQALLVDLAPEIGARLDAQAEAHVTAEGDVLLRLIRVRKARLLPAAHTERSLDELCVPVGALADHQILSGVWPALGHVLIASHPSQGADVIVTSLLATLAARCSPDQLQIWLVSEPRALPAPVAAMPHVARILDPADAAAVGVLLEDLRHDLDRRASASDRGADLVLAIAELTLLREHGTELELLMHRAAALGVHVIAASSAPAEAVQLPLVPQFATRMVLHMEDEALSVGLLGVADAAFLGGGGRLLLRFDHREPIELFGFQVTADHLERLVRVMRSAYTSAAPPAPTSPPGAPPELTNQPTESIQQPAPPAAPEAPLQAAAPTEAQPSPPATAPAPAVPSLQVLCFGGPRVLYRGQQVWPGHAAGDIKPWEFLLYLACQPLDGVSRDEAVAALWPEADIGDPPHRIRQLRYRLRTLLGDKNERARVDGISGSARLRLDPGVIYSDAQEFLELVRSARTSPDAPELTIARLERARALYVGDLLDGPEVRRYAWAEDRDESGVTLREHFRRLYQSATQSLAELYVSTHQFAAAVETYRELAQLDPGDERVWLALFRIHAARADRPALLREERRMRTALHQLASDSESDVTAGLDEPGREIMDEFRRLLADLDASERQPAAV